MALNAQIYQKRFVFKDRIIDQLIQDENLDVNFDQREMLIYERIDKQLELE